MRRVIARATLAAVAALVASGGTASAAQLERVGTYDNPVYVGSVPGDPSRLLVAEQAGRIVETGGTGTTVYLNIHDLVSSGGEQGLLSFAFPPDFATNHLMYVAYTGQDFGAFHVDELSATTTAADPSSRRSVITVPHPLYTNHNAGQLQFGPEGYLYISTGDGGGAGDTAGNAQSTSSLLGKILRIDPRASGGQPYTVPSDNPFVGKVGADEIWSYGLRNAWRFSFDPQGALVIGDVGQSAREEIDYVPQSAGGGRGANFGWNCREGFQAYVGCAGSFTEPVFDYSHTSGNCAITGGYVMGDPGIPELLGRYVYGDYCNGTIRSLALGLPRAADDRSEGLSVPSLSSFGEDACGRVYAVSFAGPVYRLVGGGPTDCGGGGGPGPASLELGKPALNTTSGTARLPATVSGPGELELSAAHLRRDVVHATRAGTFELDVKPKGKRRRRLARRGHAAFAPRVAFTPDAGEPVVGARRILLRKQG